MRIELALDLNDPGLRPFRDAWLRECARRSNQPAAAVIEGALATLTTIPADAPAICRERLAAIPVLAALLGDPGWPLTADERNRLCGALGYFQERQDLIPDDASRFGLLDDVIVLEMALAACADIWNDWCEYRAWRAAFPGEAPLDRERWHSTRDVLLRDALRRSRLSSYLARPPGECFAPVGAALDFPEAVQFGLH